MKYVYILGGLQRRNALGRNEWHSYKEARLIKVNLQSGELLQTVTYRSPPHLCADKDPSIVFKAGSILHDRLFAVTETEVLIYSVPDLEKIGHISLPCFNDLHHVCPSPDGSLMVAVTGLDMVIKISESGDILQEWGVLEQDPWRRFSRSEDYRKVSTTKPHLAHPNFVFFLDGQPWVTRFNQKDAICLTDPEKRMAVEVERVHDGVVHEGKVYFTAINGHIAVFDGVSLKRLQLMDLQAINESQRYLGWCRGVLPDGDGAWTGFSRLRATRSRENLSWIKHGFKKVGGHGGHPTRIARYDLKRQCLDREILLEPLGLSAVFAILPGED